MSEKPKSPNRKPEHPDIQRARRDVSDRANEYSLAFLAMEAANAKVQAATEVTLKERLAEFEQVAQAKVVAARKLNDAQGVLEAELKKVRRG
jgi:hypothetical protein